ncbi:Gfo/Idh/MocA family protein [Tundrisphaera lichenicola]|uniref:Gfo/Idh/MocA family protein n=1 Tax=Tundrisphaera lichenicola TaxID=2029860 RepID=UPI003EB69EDC
MPRRTFLGDCSKAVAGAAGIVSLAASSASSAPANRIQLAVMGLRGRGKGLALGFAAMPDARVSHLVDVDENLLGPLAREVAERQSSEPKAATDIRRVLEDPSVDALVIATPDHWHALATVWACQHGKHVYVEKPASQTLWEGRKMVEAARKYDRVVQVGTQSRSAPHYQEMIEYVRSGKLGEVHMAKAWNSQLRSNIGHTADSEVPKGVDYDLWQGPAQRRAFNPNRFHSTWHWNWDYGTGDIGNDGIHDLDIARWGLGVTAPASVSCVGGKWAHDDDQQVPDTQVVSFTFPESKAILIYEQRLWSPYVQEGYENGVAFYGTKGYILVGRSGWQIIGAGNKPIPTASRPFADEPHRRDFLDRIRSGGRPNADIEEGHHSAVLAHLGNIAYRVGRPLSYDAKAETILHDAEAVALLRRDYHKGFEIPDQV